MFFVQVWWWDDRCEGSIQALSGSYHSEKQVFRFPLLHWKGLIPVNLNLEPFFYRSFRLLLWFTLVTFPLFFYLLHPLDQFMFLTQFQTIRIFLSLMLSFLQDLLQKFFSQMTLPRGLSKHIQCQLLLWPHLGVRIRQWPCFQKLAQALSLQASYLGFTSHLDHQTSFRRHLLESYASIHS